MNDFYETEDRAELNDSLDKFNWGAFGLGLFWAPFNGAWNDYWMIFAIQVLFFILSNFFFGIVFYILIFCLNIYCGKKGNEWAWYGKKWKSIEEFETAQKKWTVGWLVVFIINIIIAGVIFVVGATFIKALSSPKGQGKLLGSVFVMPLSEDPQFKTAKNTEEMVDLYVKNWNQSSGSSTAAKKYSEDSILLYSPTGSRSEQILTLYKSGDCSMEKKNCYMIYYEKHGETVTPIAKTYFDLNGKTFVVNLKK